VNYEKFRTLRKDLPAWDKILAAKGMNIGNIQELAYLLNSLERVEKEYSDFF